MNIKQFSLAILISALPLSAIGQTEVQFQEQDFKAAERVSDSGETVLKVKLSKSGKAKLKKLKQGDLLQTHLAGEMRSFELKAALEGESVEIGPYSEGEAKQAVLEINN